MATETKTSTILIAEDEITTALLLQRIFDRAGYITSLARNGVETITLAQEILPDLIILDVQMPEMNGFEVLRQLRSEYITSRIPVVVVTARAILSTDIQQGFSLGADDYITKPFDPGVLLARCQSKIKSKRLEDELKSRTEELEMTVKALQRRTLELETLLSSIQHEKLKLAQRSVFISYRRDTSMHLARLVFQFLLVHNYDVFLDVATMDGGKFDQIIMNQIASRAHFILVISKNSLIRCKEENDWLRREIEEALRLERNIIPILDESVELEKEIIYLDQPLKAEILKRNSLPYSHYYSESFMQKLQEKFLGQPVSVIISPTPTDELAEVQKRIEEARIMVPTENVGKNFESN